LAANTGQHLKVDRLTMSFFELLIISKTHILQVY
jgi:hypothetical protein